MLKPFLEKDVQHLLVCELGHNILKRMKQKYNHRLRTWKLRDSAVAKEFAIFLSAKLTRTLNFSNVKEIWAHHKKCLFKTFSEVCGTFLNHQWKRQTWWWNGSVDGAVKGKNHYKALKQLQIQELFEEANIVKEAYNESKRVAKRLIWLAKSEAERSTFSANTPSLKKIYHLARQMESRNRDEMWLG